MDKSKLQPELDRLLADFSKIERLYEVTPANLEWLGRLEAAIGHWSMAGQVTFTAAVQRLRRGSALDAQYGEAAIVSLLHQARNSLRMEFGTTTNAVFAAGQEYDYFGECQKFCVRGASETCPRRRSSLATNERRGGQVGAAYYAAAFVKRSA